jgi:Tetratricopeptide repeat
LSILQEVGERRGEGMTLNGIGNVYHALGDRPQALQSHQQALNILQEVGERRGEVMTVNSIGIVYNAAGYSSKRYSSRHGDIQSTALRLSTTVARRKQSTVMQRFFIRKEPSQPNWRHFNDFASN